ncbi:MAG: calcium-binding protein [Gammaproteobacteria bacterium]|nr:calcium-binding protein [Gammaproteobacteria bacterium]
MTLTSSTANGFTGTEAQLSGFSEIDIVNGNGGTLTGDNVASTFTINDGSGSSYNDGTNTLTISGFGTYAGGSAGDTFNVTGTSTATLTGNGGNDVFDIDATLNGSADGGTGTDTLQGTQIDAVTLTGSVVDGFAGTETDVTGNFADIDTIVGNGGTLTGQDTTSTFTINDTATSSYTNGTHTLTISGFGTYAGGNQTDTFNVTGASAAILTGNGGNDVFDIDATLNGSADGGTGTDTLQGTQIDAVTLTGSVVDGFAGTETDITANFADIDTIVGNGGTLTGDNVASTFTINGASSSYNDGANTLSLSGFGTFAGGSQTDTFNVTGATAANLTGNIGSDTFTIDSTLTGTVTGGAGSDTLTGTQIDAVTLTGSTVDGLSGTETQVSAGFTGINTINAASGTLTGSTGSDTFATSGPDSGTVTVGGVSAGYSGFTSLAGGSGNDTFTIGDNVTGSVLGQTGTDTITLNGGTIATAGRWCRQRHGQLQRGHGWNLVG